MKIMEWAKKYRLPKKGFKSVPPPKKFKPALTDDERENILKLYRAETDCKQRWIFAMHFYFHRNITGLRRIIAVEKNPMVKTFAESYLKELK